MLEPALPIVPLRTSRPRRSAAHRHQEAGPHPQARPSLTGNPRDETRGAGWEFLYVAIDDHSRIAFTRHDARRKKRLPPVLSFARPSLTSPNLNIRVRRVMTDNGPCFYSHRFAHACRDLQLRHIRTRIYTPAHQRQGRAFHPDRHREWAYARLYQNSAQRTLPSRSLDPSIQLASPSHRPQPKTTHLPFWSHGKQTS